MSIPMHLRQQNHWKFTVPIFSSQIPIFASASSKPLKISYFYQIPISLPMSPYSLTCHRAKPQVVHQSHTLHVIVLCDVLANMRWGAWLFADLASSQNHIPITRLHALTSCLMPNHIQSTCLHWLRHHRPRAVHVIVLRARRHALTRVTGFVPHKTSFVEDDNRNMSFCSQFFPWTTSQSWQSLAYPSQQPTPLTTNHSIFSYRTTHTCTCQSLACNHQQTTPLTTNHSLFSHQSTPTQTCQSLIITHQQVTPHYN